jgi:decaprenyl-phosphate phosphoribosyltransferase
MRGQPVLAAAPAGEPEPPVAAAPQLLVARRRGVLHAALATMRPRQWIKNGLILAAAGAAGALGREGVPLRVGLAVLAFCLVSGGIYAVNDVRDRHEDRLHPRKRFRPVAAGELSVRSALGFGLALIAAGLIVCVAVRPLLGLVAAGYVALTLSYTLLWRTVVLVDLIAIAGGFVLRAIAGGVAAPVTLSRWFLLVITAAAVMVAAGKRHSELRRTAVADIPRRRVLDHYSSGLLMTILAGSALVALFAYCMWAAAIPTIHGVPWRPLSAIPFAACLARYGALVRLGAGETPEELVLGDPVLALSGLAWLVIFALGVHAAG